MEGQTRCRSRGRNSHRADLSTGFSPFPASHSRGRSRRCALLGSFSRFRKMRGPYRLPLPECLAHFRSRRGRLLGFWRVTPSAFPKCRQTGAGIRIDTANFFLGNSRVECVLGQVTRVTATRNAATGQRWFHGYSPLQHVGPQHASCARFGLTARTNALMNFSSTCAAMASASMLEEERNSRASSMR